MISIVGVHPICRIGTLYNNLYAKVKLVDLAGAGCRKAWGLEMRETAVVSGQSLT